MIRTLKIENFRCFRKLELGTKKEPLRRVSLVTGMNNTGKTSLLEAVWLSTGWFNPNLPFLVNGKRGLGVAGEELNWLFHNRSRPVANILTVENGRPSRQTSVEISVRPFAGAPARKQTDSGRDLPPPELQRANVSIDSGVASEIVLERHVRGQRRAPKAERNGTNRSRLGFTVTGHVLFREMPSIPGLNAYYIDPRIHNHHEDAQRFSELTVENRKQEVVNALKIFDPRITDAQVLLTGGAPMVHVTTDAKQVLPVALYGQGVGRFLSFVLAILNARDSLVLIDEFENGIHYSSLENCWKAVFAAAHVVNSQVFATTHSRECIIAAHAAATSMKPYDLAVMRLDREGDEIEPVYLTQGILDTMVEMNVEMR